MRILYLSYWGINDFLTVSTVFPNLYVLQNFENVDRIILVTIERGTEKIDPYTFVGSKISHLPFTSKGTGLFSKIDDFIKIPAFLKKLAKKERPDLIIARGAPTGILANAASRSTGIPFIVESFEPHSKYMLDSGVWSKWGLKYNYESYYEEVVKKNAQSLITVSLNYQEKLKNEKNVMGHIFTVPCCVDFEKFRFSEVDRATIRAKYNLNGKVVGIYVGKFGDIYYEDEAFMIFRAAFDVFLNFRLIILSPQGREYIEAKLLKFNINPETVVIAKVPHHEVPRYLSASDFAFSTIKAAPSKKYCSPIKDGEYWANGLPILLTDNIGDDAEIIKKEGGGAVFNLEEKESLPRALQILKETLSQPGYRKLNEELAFKYRSMDIIPEVYKEVFSTL